LNNFYKLSTTYLQVFFFWMLCSELILYLLVFIYKKLDFLKAHDIYKLELAKLMYKFHDGLFPSIYNSLFQRSSDLHNYNARYASNQNHFIPSVHSNIGKKLISYKGAVIWREINAEYKNLPFHRFKISM